MRPNLLAAVVLILSSSASLPAFAQDANCPATDWFCSTNETQVVETETLEVAPAEDDVRPAAPPSKTPPVVIIIVKPGAKVQTPPPSRPAPVRRARPVVRQAAPRKQPVAAPKTVNGWKPTAGFEFRVQRFWFMGDAAQSNASEDTSMLGGGAGVRIPFRQKLEIDLQNEFFYGTDLNGFDRSEVGVSVHLVRYLNPTASRFYTIAGGYLGLGNVSSDKPSPLLPVRADDGLYYATAGIVGAQAGLGAEVRLTPFLSIRADAQFAMRWRFSATQDMPEYIDPDSGRGANSYPGFLLRAGMTIW